VTVKSTVSLLTHGAVPFYHWHSRRKMRVCLQNMASRALQSIFSAQRRRWSRVCFFENSTTHTPSTNRVRHSKLLLSAGTFRAASPGFFPKTVLIMQTQLYLLGRGENDRTSTHLHTHMTQYTHTHTHTHAPQHHTIHVLYRPDGVASSREP
jgi:hypothetical protein